MRKCGPDVSLSLNSRMRRTCPGATYPVRTAWDLRTSRRSVPAVRGSEDRNNVYLISLTIYGPVAAREATTQRIRQSRRRTRASPLGRGTGV